MLKTSTAGTNTLFSLTYKVLTTTQPHLTFITSSLFSVLEVGLLSLHPSLLLQCSATDIILCKSTDRSLRYASPCLWNQLPLSLHQPHTGTSYSSIPSPITFSSFYSPLGLIHNSPSFLLPA